MNKTNIVKNKRASILVEKIMMTAFAVAAGAAVVIYGTNVINQSKNADINVGLPVAENSRGVELVKGHIYRFKREMGEENFRNLKKEDMEYFLVSNVYNTDGTEYLISGGPAKVFFGYSCWACDESNQTFYLEDPNECCACGLYDYYSEEVAKRAWGDNIGWWQNDNYPRLNDWGCDGGFYYVNQTFKFGGTYVRRGNGPNLLEFLEEVKE